MTIRYRRLFALAAFSTALFAANQSQAQVQSGFSLNRYDPAERGSDWFANESLDFRGHVRPAAGLTFDYGYKPLVAFDANDNEKFAIVKHQLHAHIGVAFNFWDRLRVGVNLPVALYQEGDGGSFSNGQSFQKPSSTTVGDVRLGADVRIFGKYGDPATAAFGVQLFIPSGKRDDYTGDGNVRVVPRFMLAGDVKMFTYALKLSMMYRGLEDSYAGEARGSEFGFSAAAGVRLLQKKLIIGPEVYGATILKDNAFGRAATPFELILGGRYTVGDFRVGMGVGPGLTRGLGTPVVRGLATFEWFPAPKEKKVAPPPPPDADKDGILDKDDACPNDAGPKTSDPSTTGCPDSDKDGIIDKLDACPNEPGAANADPKKNGCPDTDKDGIIDKEDACPNDPGIPSEDPKKHGCADADKDGILDKDDACPNEAGPASEDPKKNGCPDTDKDGIIDKVDACPNEPGKPDEDPKKNGCPDTDGDGIIDKEDACPNDKGKPDPDPKKNGCPLVIKTDDQIKIFQQVKFKTGSDIIEKSSDELLTAVAQILKDNKDIKKVLVEGHTDNKGNKNMNKGLSQRRAAAVVRWLINKGKVERKRFDSRGWGQEHPIDSNDTDDGRQNNRRVEFHILEDKAGKHQPKYNPPNK